MLHANSHFSFSHDYQSENVSVAGGSYSSSREKNLRVLWKMNEVMKFGCERQMMAQMFELFIVDSHKIFDQ